MIVPCEFEIQIFNEIQGRSKTCASRGGGKMFLEESRSTLFGSVIHRPTICYQNQMDNVRARKD